MGACQSTSAADVSNTPISIKSQGTASSSKFVRGSDTEADADSHVIQLQTKIDEMESAAPTSTVTVAETVQRRTEALKGDVSASKSSQFKNQPGYSSGGSSLVHTSSSSSECGETKASRMKRSSSRHEKLCEWKQELAENGDLTTKIVRIETDFGRDIEDVYEGVRDGHILGEGVAGVVRKVKHRNTGVYFAVKVLNLGLLVSDSVMESLREEIFTMCQLDHPNIIRLEEVYESETQIFLIQELCEGGDLFDRLDEQPEDEPYHYSEVQCAKLVKQMLSAVRYLHSRKIVHRDLKLENFLFESKDSDDLKMIDFGLSKHFKSDEALLHEAVGTPYTVAPEIIKGSYNCKADIWSIGVITYLLLSGESPFGGIYGEDELQAVRNNILVCHLPFEPKEIWDEISPEAKKFVRRCLTINPQCRPTAREAQQDEWLQKYSIMDVEGSKVLNSDIVNNLLKFKDYSDMHRVLLDVLSFALLPEQIHKLKAEFQKMDPDGGGEVTLEELKEVLLNRAEAGSLGSLDEKEVDDIFNALRTKDSETTIRWHEFLAAAVSRSDFDDRNLKLAFDRLDYDRKGYITHSNMCEILCTSDGKLDSAVLKMWRDGLKEIKCKENDKITFEEFRMFLKGQIPKDVMHSHTRTLSGRKLVNSTLELQSVIEESASQRSQNDNKLSSSDKSRPILPPKIRAPRAVSVVLQPSDSMVRGGDDDYDLPSDRHTRTEPSETQLHPESEVLRKRQEFRMSILQASKLFDQKRQEIRPGVPNPAGLTMVAGTRRPSAGDPNSTDKDAVTKLAAASRKSGRRNRKNREKTNSDVSLLFR